MRAAFPRERRVGGRGDSFQETEPKVLHFLPDAEQNFFPSARDVGFSNVERCHTVTLPFGKHLILPVGEFAARQSSRSSFRAASRARTRRWRGLM